MIDCPLCDRKAAGSNHHLVPKCRGGASKELICIDCHEAIHALFSNKQLESEFDSVDSLLSDDTFRKTVKFISRQDPTRHVKTRLANSQKKRGRNG